MVTACLLQILTVFLLIKTKNNFNMARKWFDDYASTLKLAEKVLRLTPEKTKEDYGFNEYMAKEFARNQDLPSIHLARATFANIKNSPNKVLPYLSFDKSSPTWKFIRFFARQLLDDNSNHVPVANYTIINAFADSPDAKFSSAKTAQECISNCTLDNKCNAVEFREVTADGNPSCQLYGTIDGLKASNNKIYGKKAVFTPEKVSSLLKTAKVNK